MCENAEDRRLRSQSSAPNRSEGGLQSDGAAALPYCPGLARPPDARALATTLAGALLRNRLLHRLPLRLRLHRCLSHGQSLWFLSLSCSNQFELRNLEQYQGICLSEGEKTTVFSEVFAYTCCCKYTFRQDLVVFLQCVSQLRAIAAHNPRDQCQHAERNGARRKAAAERLPWSHPAAIRLGARLRPPCGDVLRAASRRALLPGGGARRSRACAALAPTICAPTSPSCVLRFWPLVMSLSRFPACFCP